MQFEVCAAANASLLRRFAYWPFQVTTAGLALALRERVGRPQRALYRLVGVGLANFLDPDEHQPELF